MKIKRRDTLLRVLSTIANAGVAFGRHPARHALSVYRAARDFEELQESTDRELRRVSEYIVKKKYVTIERGEYGHASLILSHAGKKVMGMHALRELRPPRQKTWDRKWRIVLFDIPNHAKSARDAFAATLKRLGFLTVQKSVFVCPYPCEEELEVVADFYGVGEYVEIIVAERFTREKEFKKVFGLR